MRWRDPEVEIQPDDSMGEGGRGRRLEEEHTVGELLQKIMMHEPQHWHEDGKTRGPSYLGDRIIRTWRLSWV